MGQFIFLGIDALLFIFRLLIFGSGQMSCYTCFLLLTSFSPGTITEGGYIGHTALSLRFLYHQTAVQDTHYIHAHGSNWFPLTDPFMPLPMYLISIYVFFHFFLNRDFNDTIYDMLP